MMWRFSGGIVTAMPACMVSKWAISSVVCANAIVYGYFLVGMCDSIFSKSTSAGMVGEMAQVMVRF